MFVFSQSEVISTLNIIDIILVLLCTLAVS